MASGFLALGDAPRGTRLQQRASQVSISPVQLRRGYNDLNRDGLPDCLYFRWRQWNAIFIADDGRLPFAREDEGRDWSDYFDLSFNVHSNVLITWNELRRTWGNYTLLVDVDHDGRYDAPGDVYMKVLDLNGDGYPEVVLYVFGSLCHVFFDLDCNHELCVLDWLNLVPGHLPQHEYYGRSSYLAPYHGNGCFLNGYQFFEDPRYGAEIPIAFYDLNGDGWTDVTLRVGTDVYRQKPSEVDPRPVNYGIAIDLDRASNRHDPIHFDMFIRFNGRGPDYTAFPENFPGLRGMPEADWLFERRMKFRTETRRFIWPYWDGYRIATDHEGWSSLRLLFDEDNDDNRWEEMFFPYDPDDTTLRYDNIADCLGDRVEVDRTNRGKGRIYVGYFDRRLHLYGADSGLWTVDYLALFRGSQYDKIWMDDIGHPELMRANEPPPVADGTLYNFVKYYDKDGDGIFDWIEYGWAEYGLEDRTRIIERHVDLTRFAKRGLPSPEIIDIRVDTPLSGRRLQDWKGQPYREAVPAVKAFYDRLTSRFERLAEESYREAQVLLQTAGQLNLLGQEPEFIIPGAETLPLRERLLLKDVRVKPGLGKLLSPPTTLHDLYHKGYWIREKSFARIRESLSKDVTALDTSEYLYYSGQIDELCRRLNRTSK